MLHVFNNTISATRPCSFLLLTDLDAMPGHVSGHTDVIKWTDDESREAQAERFIRTKASALCIDSYNVDIDGQFAATTEY